MKDQSVFGEIISSYSREQAIADGVLVDASVMAREAGFVFPVALTAAVWQDCVAWSDEDSKRQTYQDEFGRLWDVLWLAKLAARKAHGSRVEFRLYRVPRGGRGISARIVSLHLVIGPGDAGDPVITLMMPNED